MEEFFLQNWVTIIGWFGTIASLIWGGVERIKSEKLKSKLELEKDKNLLNDKKFREAYESFIALMFSVVQKKKDVNIEGGMIEFMKKTLLFSGPETIKTFGLYRKEAGLSKENILIYLEDLILSMRKDLGVSNAGIKRYDIIQVFIVGNAKEEAERIVNE